MIVCGNLFAEPAGAAARRRPESLTGPRRPPPSLAQAIAEFTGPPDCRLHGAARVAGPRGDAGPRGGPRCVPGVEVAPASPGPRPPPPAAAGAGPPRPPAGRRPGHHRRRAGQGRPWLAGIDRLEDAEATRRFVTSRTLYRRFGRYAWVAPLLAIALAIVIRMEFVYHSVYRLVRRASGPRHALYRAYGASWGSRLLFTLAVIVVLELVVGGWWPWPPGGSGRASAAGIPAPSQRPWSAERSGRRGPRPLGARSASMVGRVLDALDEARALVAAGATGLVTGGSLRAELTHLGTGFFACPGGTTELVREHRGPPGPPPVFLHHRQAGWIELETGADLHVRLLLADVDLPSSTALERIATGYHVVKGYKPAADLHPALVAAWPRGASWPPAPTWPPAGCGCAGSGGWPAGPSSWPACSTCCVAVSRPRPPTST